MNIFLNAVGQSEDHICFDSLECPVNREVVEKITSLKKDAAASGINLCIASGYRSFSRQLSIWNAKARGERQILDDFGRVVDPGFMDDKTRLFAILRWSALPGASRHHWGTDVDIYDGNTISASTLKLVPAEYREQGPCYTLYCWLKALVSDDFFWPYSSDCGGVAPEPWHISFTGIAEHYKNALCEDKLYSVIEKADIELKASILENFDEIYERFILTGLK